MKVLFTGSRKWTNEEAIMDWMIDFPPNTVVLHGAALFWKWHEGELVGGADRLADKWGRLVGHHVKPYPVDHALDGPWPAAGVNRNHRMVINEHRPDSPIDLCLAFPLADSRGTWDMVYRAKLAHIPVWEAPKALWR
jgi:hypothetical protein